MRLMKKDKFAPYVRDVLRKSNVLANSQKQQLDRLEQFKMEDREKKAEYDAKMMEIYAKVLNRPLLVENSGQYGENDVNRVTKLNYQQEHYHHEPRHHNQQHQQRNEERLRQEREREHQLQMRQPNKPPAPEKMPNPQKQALQKESPQHELQHQQQRLQMRAPGNEHRGDETS